MLMEIGMQRQVVIVGKCMDLSVLICSVRAFKPINHLIFICK
jgi:hypothetical protein